MKIFMKGKVETVSVDRVKPAHSECEPETGTKIKRKSNQKQRIQICRDRLWDPKGPNKIQ